MHMDTNVKKRLCVRANLRAQVPFPVLLIYRGRWLRSFMAMGQTREGILKEASVYRDGLKGGPVLLSNSQAGLSRKFSPTFQ